MSTRGGSLSNLTSRTSSPSKSRRSSPPKGKTRRQSKDLKDIEEFEPDVAWKRCKIKVQGAYLARKMVRALVSSCPPMPTLSSKEMKMLRAGDTVEYLDETPPRGTGEWCMATILSRRAKVLVLLQNRTTFGLKLFANRHFFLLFPLEEKIIWVYLERQKKQVQTHFSAYDQFSRPLTTSLILKFP